MWNKIIKFFKPPIFEDEDKTRIANLLSIILLTIFIIALVRTILALLLEKNAFRLVLNMDYILMVMILIILIIMHKGFVQLACFVFTAYQWFIMAWLTLNYGGLSVSAFSFFIFVIIAAGLLLGGKWAIRYALLSIIYGILLLSLEKNGIIIPVEESSEIAFMTIVPSFITTAVMVFLYHRDITTALLQARQNASEIIKTNLQLNKEVASRKMIEEKLTQSQKMEAIGQLAGGVAHDFNNILTVINGYAEILLKLDLPESLYGPIKEIQTAGIRASRLTSQLLAFSRKQIIQPRIINLNIIIKDQINMLRRLLGEDVEISTLPDTDLRPIKADPGQVEQVIMNISINARDAMPTGGKLIFETKNVEFDQDSDEKHPDVKPGKFTMLSISDTGIGMDKNTRSHIFEPFFTTKGRDKGTGLGLATVYGIIRQNDGFITVKSEVQNGSSFKIYLPSVDSKDDSSEAESSREIDLSGTEKILLVEDDPGVRNVTKSTLQKYGYTVVTASNGEEAIRTYNKHNGKFDLLLTDVIMPLMSGRELAEALHKKNNNLKILYFSGYTDDSIVRHGIISEGMEFIQKPYTHAELAKKVKTVLIK